LVLKVKKVDATTFAGVRAPLGAKMSGISGRFLRNRKIYLKITEIDSFWVLKIGLECYLLTIKSILMMFQQKREHFLG
jgi:hypothetical protein